MRILKALVVSGVSVALLANCSNAELSSSAQKIDSVKKSIVAGESKTEKAFDELKPVSDKTAKSVSKQLKNPNVSTKQKWFLGCNALNVAFVSKTARNNASIKVLEEVAKVAPTKEQRAWGKTAVGLAKSGKKASQLPRSLRNQVVAPCEKRGVNMKYVK